MILILAGAVFFAHGFLGKVADISQAQKLLEPLLGSKIAPIVFLLLPLLHQDKVLHHNGYIGRPGGYGGLS